MNKEDSNMVAQAQCHTAYIETNLALEHYAEKNRPFMLLRPRIFIDGNRWCALYGENLQDGVAGFGDSPFTASHAFDTEWHNKLPGKLVCQDCGHAHNEESRINPNKHSDTNVCPSCGSSAALRDGE